MLQAARCARHAAWLPPPVCAARRSLHASRAVAQQAKAKGKGAAVAAPVLVEKYDLATQIPVNLLKEGPEPEYQPDSAYPPWLARLLDEKPLVEDVLMRGVENLTQPQMKLVIRATRKHRIKTRNASTEKAGGDE